MAWIVIPLSSGNLNCSCKTQLMRLSKLLSSYPHYSTVMLTASYGLAYFQQNSLCDQIGLMSTYSILSKIERGKILSDFPNYNSLLLSMLWALMYFLLIFRKILSCFHIKEGQMNTGNSKNCGIFLENEPCFSAIFCVFASS